MKVRHAGLIVAVLAIGALVGTASSMADGVPYEADWYGLEKASLPLLLLYIGVSLLDTYVGWLVGPLLLAYTTCRSALESAFTGAGYVVVTLAIYHLSAYRRDLSAYQRAQNELSGDFEIPEPVLADHLSWAVLEYRMLPLALAGGLVGTLAGFYARRWPPLLLALSAAVALDLVRRAHTSWTSAINGPLNYLLVATGLAAVVWSAVATFRKRSAFGDRDGQGGITRESEAETSS